MEEDALPRQEEVAAVCEPSPYDQFHRRQFLTDVEEPELSPSTKQTEDEVEVNAETSQGQETCDMVVPDYVDWHCDREVGRWHGFSSRHQLLRSLILRDEVAYRRTCSECDEVFYPRRFDAVTCGPRCRQRRKRRRL